MQLFKHQIDALERTRNRKRCAYYHEMGTGKTFTGGEKLISLNSKVNLVVCQKSKVDDWVNHFKFNYPCKYCVVDLTDKKGFDHFTNHCIKYADEGYIPIGVINYDLLFRRVQLLNLRDFTLMLDESSLIQNETAKRSKFILKMQPDNVILLSGTPTGGKYEKLWSQVRLLGWNISKKDYWDRYINWEFMQFGRMPFPVKQVTGYKNVEELKAQLRRYGADFLKADESSLPTQTFIDVSVPASKEYRKFMKNNIIEIDDIELVGDNSLKKLLYARQLCGAYSKDKLNAFKDLLDGTDERVIVFYNFTNELTALKEIAHDRPISVVNGQTKNLTAYENESNSVTFCQYQASSMGLNLQKANKIVYYTLPLSCENYMQSLKRIHRIGQTKPCFYYFMMCENSIEQRIYERLKKGEDYTNRLFENDYL